MFTAAGPSLTCHVKSGRNQSAGRLSSDMIGDSGIFCTTKKIISRRTVKVSGGQIAAGIYGRFLMTSHLEWKIIA